MSLLQLFFALFWSRGKRVLIRPFLKHVIEGGGRMRSRRHVIGERWAKWKGLLRKVSLNEAMT